MEDNQEDAAEDSNLHQHLFEAHLQNKLAGKDQQRGFMGKSGTGSSGQADSAEEVGLDWTHP